MSSQMPELGSKISLISKADIRYEGRLFQVDPQECTIALANVRSFGTEDRETLYPVPAQSQVYEYILFRGSDIKDIRIVPAALPQDPAIVQLVPHQPPQQQTGPGFGNPGLSHSVLGQSSHPLGGFAGYGVGMGLQRAPGPPGPLMMQPSELGPSLTGPGPSNHDKEQDLMGGLSRSTTPSLTRKSPTMDQGTQVNKSPPHDEHKTHPRPIQPPDRDGHRREAQLYQPGQGGYRQRDGPENRENRRPFHENNRADYVRNDMYNRRNNQNNYRRDYRDQYDNNQFQNRGQQNRQPGEGWIPRNQNQNMQGGMQNMQGAMQMQNRQGGGMMQRGGRGRGTGRPLNPRAGAPLPNKKNPLKFDDDYDFDKANNEFEELRSQLTKLKVNDDSVVGGEPKVELEKKEDSGNETGTGEPDHPDDEVFYDKKKSFFDTISCEAVERSKGRSQRTDWRTERKLNTETFGVSSARRGMYRGRGYYGNQRNYGYRPRNNQQQQDGAAPAPAAPADPLPKSAVAEVVVTPAVVDLATPVAAS